MTDEGPQLHEKMQQFETRDHVGNLLSTEGYAGRPWVLLMLSVGCEPCEDLLQQVQTVRRRIATAADILIVLEATPQVVADTVRRYRLSVPVVSDPGLRLRASLRIDRTPYGLAIDEMGKVRMKGVVNTGEQLEGLIWHRGRPMSGAQQWETEPASASHSVASR